MVDCCDSLQSSSQTSRRLRVTTLLESLHAFINLLIVSPYFSFDSRQRSAQGAPTPAIARARHSSPPSHSFHQKPLPIVASEPKFLEGRHDPAPPPPHWALVTAANPVFPVIAQTASRGRQCFQVQQQLRSLLECLAPPQLHPSQLLLPNFRAPVLRGPSALLPALGCHHRCLHQRQPREW